jgi:Tn3 transposase DDE domain
MNEGSTHKAICSSRSATVLWVEGGPTTYCLVYINTLMLQDILADPAWMRRMTAEDFRALSPLVYTHINPYGTFELDMDARLPLAA